MQLKKFIDRIGFIEKLIENEATGTPKQLADRMRVSERTLLRYIEYMREDGKKITFCPIKKSYKYFDD